MKLETYLNAVEQDHVLTSPELLEIIRAAQEEAWSEGYNAGWNGAGTNPYMER